LTAETAETEWFDDLTMSVFKKYVVSGFSRTVGGSA
jgi:hypothetical protein